MYGNGFVPTENQLSMLREFKANYQGVVADEHIVGVPIVGVPTQGEMSATEMAFYTQGAWKTLSDFQTEAEMRALMECVGGSWDSLPVPGAHLRQVMILVAMWEEVHADVSGDALAVLNDSQPLKLKMVDSSDRFDFTLRKKRGVQVMKAFGVCWLWELC